MDTSARPEATLNAPFRYEGGLSALLTGGFLFLGHLFNLGADAEPGTPSGLGFILAAHILAVLAFVGLQARQEKAAGALGRVGAVLAIVGTVAVSAVVYVQLAQAAGVEVQAVLRAPGTKEVAALGPLVFVFGLLLFGAAVVKARVLPSSGGVALIAGTIVFAAGTLSIGAAPYVEAVGAAVTGFGFIRLGAALLAPPPRASSPPA